jgi:hypothetical protein
MGTDVNDKQRDKCYADVYRGPPTQLILHPHNPSSHPKRTLNTPAVFTHPLLVTVVSKPLKKRIYQTLIRPVVTYGGETWTSTDENALRISERY